MVLKRLSDALWIGYGKKLDVGIQPPLDILQDDRLW
jgi:hypothetical protein